MKLFNKYLLFSLTTLILALTSCDPAKEFETELSTIDSCMQHLDSIEQIHKGINFDSLELMVTHIMENEDKIKNYYVSDTVDRELGELMNNCKGFRKSLKNAKGMGLTFIDEIFAIRKQLENLKTDILNGVFDKEQVKTYLAEEKDALNKLSLKFFDFNHMQQMQVQIYHQAVPKVDAYVAKLVIPDDVPLEP